MTIIDNISYYWAEILKYSTKSYIKTLIILFTIMLIINMCMIGASQFDEPDYKGRNFGNTITDSVYFTTAQFSTVGYGDITAKTGIAKWISSFFHIIIIFISLDLLSKINDKIDNLNTYKYENREFERLLP